MPKSSAQVLRAALAAALFCLSLALGPAAAAEREFITSTSQVTGGPTQLLQVEMTKVAEEMGGEISFNHYDNSTLFKSAAEFQAVYDGNIDIGFLSCSWFYDNGAKWAGMFGASYLFDSYEHAKRTFDPDTEVGAWFQKAIWDEFHMWPICGFYLSGRNVWMRDAGKIIKTPEDMKGVKLRMPNGAQWMMVGESLGASATTLDTNEVYLALQTGTIDAQENNMLSSYANSFQEVTKSLVMTNHQYTFNVVVVSGDVWESLGDAEKADLTKLVREATDRNDRIIIDKEAEIVRNCREKYRMTIQEPDLEAFRRHALRYFLEDPSAREWNMEIYEKVVGKQ